jgi:hypothetical protein
MIRRFVTSRLGTSTAEKATGPGTRRSRRSRPALEALEGRQLMSLGPEMISPVNTTTLSDQFDSDNASSSNGSSVVVWTDFSLLSTRGSDIRAQLFNSAGAKVGREFVVGSSNLNDTEPAVAMDARGDFVVSWTQAQPNGDTNVVARLFNPAGIPQDGIVQVGAGTFREHASDVAMSAAGGFTVAYVRDTNNNNPDVFAKQYDGFGNLLNVVNVATTSRAETSPSIAMTPDGRFDVTWEDAWSNSEHNIRMNTYAANGILTNTFLISPTATLDILPSVAVDNNGNSVTAWSTPGNGGSDVKARRVSVSGIAGPVLTIASTSDSESGPSVAMKRGGGSFVVAYDSDSGSRFQVMVAEVSASNAITTLDAGQPRFGTAVSIDGFDNYIVTYTARDKLDLNIHERRGHLA